MPIAHSSENLQQPRTNSLSQFPQVSMQSGLQLKLSLCTQSFRLRFDPRFARWYLQTRAESQFFWRTVRTFTIEGEGEFISPLYFTTPAEAEEYLRGILA